MGTDKRARQKANRQTKVAAIEAETTREIREVSTKKYGRWAAIAAGIIALFFVINLFSGDDTPESSGDFIPAAAPEEEPTPVPEIVLADEVPADFAPFAGEGALALVEPAARDNAYDAAPAMTIDPERVYAAVLNTSVGPIRLNLFADEAPLAVNNFVALARDGFFDDLTLSLNADVVMGGDPSGSGTGGPGYTFADELNTGRLFDQRGQLAMVNSGPDANGSQFFITTTGAEGVPSDFDNKNTIFGEVADESPALDAVPAAGAGEPVTIESIRIFES